MDLRGKALIFAQFLIEIMDLYIQFLLFFFRDRLICSFECYVDLYFDKFYRLKISTRNELNGAKGGL